MKFLKSFLLLSVLGLVSLTLTVNADSQESGCSVKTYERTKDLSKKIVKELQNVDQAVMDLESSFAQGFSGQDNTASASEALHHLTLSVLNTIYWVKRTTPIGSGASQKVQKVVKKASETITTLVGVLSQNSDLIRQAKLMGFTETFLITYDKLFRDLTNAFCETDVTPEEAHGEILNYMEKIDCSLDQAVQVYLSALELPVTPIQDPTPGGGHHPRSLLTKWE
ncbi:hypothetical protein IE53DRAFT_363942 [Violaceomyces palustris]|uniref:Uncharacterized protein n=1 Tax=Violaceomyces palustris TaxID=1673888 RepID=A0ACD0NRH6_9BASI|nr:hypothetical protein IE53DRAFT_363942 [Violaceomyces palustris]